MCAATVKCDHLEYYLTCARVRTYKVIMCIYGVPKMYGLEHTKPLFNEHQILSLENMYYYHTFM